MSGFYPADKSNRGLPDFPEISYLFEISPMGTQAEKKKSIYISVCPKL